jgi:hypothetical protein
MKELKDERRRARLNRREFMSAVSAATGFSADGVAQIAGSVPRKV